MKNNMQDLEKDILEREESNEQLCKRTDCGETKMQPISDNVTQCEQERTVSIRPAITRQQSECHEKRYEKMFVDITGQRFGRLVAQFPVQGQRKNGSRIWHCRCDCGNEVDVSYNALRYSNQVSCGCKKKEHDHKLSKLQVRVDGTSLDLIQSRKIPSNSTTGVRGVSFIKGKYVAKVVFQKKVYHLGSYETLEEAADARKLAEKTLFDATVRYYTQWKTLAEQDPSWAKENPIRISVAKTDGTLSISFLPKLESAD